MQMFCSLSAYLFLAKFHSYSYIVVLNRNKFAQTVHQLSDLVHGCEF